MIFLLDNYDSFSYNLYQFVRGLGFDVTVARNDELSVDAVVALEPACIILSPGPGRPEDSGIMQELIATTMGQIPLFGVCLGMQGLGMHCGGKVVKAKELMHGKMCTIEHDGKTTFTGLEQNLEVMRYHSLALEDCPAQLSVAATSSDGEIMAIRHTEYAVEGVQFHPESFATPQGPQMLANFLNHYDIRK